MRPAMHADYSGCIEISCWRVEWVGDQAVILTKSNLGNLVLLASFLLLSPHVFAQSEAWPRKPKLVTFSEAENSKELYVAVMGEVSKPGTYHLDSASLNLHTVITRAAGMTPDASKVIRVIRNGRDHQKVIYSETANSSVMPGDLLIVDPKPSNGFTSRVQEFATESTTIHASYEERAQTLVIQVAVLNVLDYPIVLKLRPEDASVNRIVEGLQQPIQLIADADIITPGRRVKSDVAKQLPRLADGSAIVFKKNSIDRSRLPSTLPKPIESEIALGAQSGLIGNSFGQSQELRSLGQRLSSLSQDSNDAPSRYTSRSDIEVSRPSNGSPNFAPNDLRSELSPPPANGSPRIATIPFSGSAQLKNSSTTSSRIDDVVNSTLPEPDDSVLENPPSALENDPSNSGDEMAEEKPPAFSLLQIVIVFITVSSLIGAVVVLRRIIEANSRPNQKTAAIIESQQLAQELAAAFRQPTVAKPLLDQLIKNELSIKLEQVEFPQGLKLQGQIAPKPALRVDGPQSILKQQGPHFTSLDRSQRSNQDVVAQLDSPEEVPVRRPHFMDSDSRKAVAETSSGRSAGESAGTGAKAPLANALFELGQGGRS